MFQGHRASAAASEKVRIHVIVCFPISFHKQAAVFLTNIADAHTKHQIWQTF
jgi:hypothetical protein